MANKRQLVLSIFKKRTMKLDRCETISGSYKEEARNLCAFIIEYLPSGTVEEFTKISGANMEKIFDVGNEAFAER